MKIAIIGSRGIPNNYGGFEECATQLSRLWVRKGYEVTVYNSSLHPYEDDEWEGVKIVHQNDPEDKIGSTGQFVFDLNCIRHARKQGFDLILQLGYTSSGIWQWLLPSKSKLITNMDGIEWKRSKYNQWVKRFLKWSESLAANRAHQLIADHPSIQGHLDYRFGTGSVYIPYGATIPESLNSDVPIKYGVKPGEYHLVMARMEPENNVHLILKGIQRSQEQMPTLVVGHNRSTDYSRNLEEEFKSSQILFHPGVFERAEADALRYYSKRYFHGHSVGGTNPSLLEAMACQCLIYAHQNVFNEYVLGKNARYFDSADTITELLNDPMSPLDAAIWKKRNLERIRREYQWQSIADQYEILFQQLLIS